jgi:biopolymer transport protein ExbB
LHIAVVEKKHTLRETVAMRPGINRGLRSGRLAAFVLFAMAAWMCSFAALDATAQPPVDPDAAAAGGAAPAPAPEAPGAPAAKPAATAAAEESALEFYFNALGWRYTIAFGVMSFAFVALVILNFLALRRQAVIPDSLIQNFEAALNEKNYQGAYDLAKADESFLGALLAAGMSKLQQGYDASEAAMNEVGEDEAMKLEHRLSYIALIGSLAPMVGLLGTVDGMVIAFEVIAKSSTSPSPAELAKGIQTALITTLVGLVMAIPAIGLFAYFKNKLARFIFDVGAVAEGLMSRFKTVKK